MHIKKNLGQWITITDYLERWLENARWVCITFNIIWNFDFMEKKKKTLVPELQDLA